MNQRQSRMLTLAAILAAVVIIYPPWVGVNPRGQATEAIGYSFIFSPPSRMDVENDPRLARIYGHEPGVPYKVEIDSRVDLTRLLLQLFALGLAVGGLYLWYREQESQ